MFELSSRQFNRGKSVAGDAIVKKLNMIDAALSAFAPTRTVRSEVRILSPDQSKSKQPNYFRAAIIGGLISFTVSRLSAEDFDNEDAVGSHDCGPRLEP